MQIHCKQLISFITHTCFIITPAKLLLTAAAVAAATTFLPSCPLLKTSQTSSSLLFPRFRLSLSLSLCPQAARTTTIAALLASSLLALLPLLPATPLPQRSQELEEERKGRKERQEEGIVWAKQQTAETSLNPNQKPVNNQSPK